MITPQAAFELAQGATRVPSFLEMARPGPARPMPAVAGMQRSTLEAMAKSSGPPMGRPAGPQQTPITYPAGQRNGYQTNGVTDCPGCQRQVLPTLGQLGIAPKLFSPSTWPTWAKFLVPLLLLGGGTAIVIVAWKKRRGHSDDYAY